VGALHLANPVDGCFLRRPGHSRRKSAGDDAVIAPNFDIIDPWCEAWKPVGESDRDRDEQIPEHMVAPLAFACEWYEHYTLNFGAHYRDSRNMNGEGP
jgi:hypothetical protein